MHASNKTVSEDEVEGDVFSRRPLYCGHAGSDVMDCRRPTGGVFTYVSSDTSHAERAFSVATPRGRSSQFPWRGTIYFFMFGVIFSKLDTRH